MVWRTLSTRAPGPGEAVTGEVFVAEIAFAKLRFSRQFAGQRALDATGHDHADVVLLRRCRQKLGLRFLLENIVDDLHGIEPPAAHEIDERVLVVLRCADADRAELSFLLELSQCLQRRRIAVPRAVFQV